MPFLFEGFFLNKGESSTLIELSKDKFVVLKVNEKIPQKEKAFDEVSTQLIAVRSNFVHHKSHHRLASARKIRC
jgi:hypothetical protein